MSPGRIAALALSGALLAGGAGVAIAAVTKDEPGKVQQEILADAAKRLDVTPDKLRDALGAAQDAQLDKAVTAGKLTQKQADLIKERRKQSGDVLGHRLFLGPPELKLRARRGGRPFFRGGPGLPPGKAMGMGIAVFPDIAKAIGITRKQLFEGLRGGKSMADLAKAQGKSLDDVRAALKADAKKKTDKAVAGGDLTRSQADDMLAHMDKMLEHLGEKRDFPKRFRRRGGEGPDLRPGGAFPVPPDAGPVDVVPG